MASLTPSWFFLASVSSFVAATLQLATTEAPGSCLFTKQSLETPTFPPHKLTIGWNVPK